MVFSAIENSSLEGFQNIRELIALSALDDIVEDEDGAVVAALENENILVLGLLVVEDLVNLEVHGLAGPHVRLLGEPAICRKKRRANVSEEG